MNKYLEELSENSQVMRQYEKYLSSPMAKMMEYIFTNCSKQELEGFTDRFTGVATTEEQDCE